MAATLGDDTIARFARLMESDPVTPFIFSAPPDELFAGFRDQLDGAIALMRSTAPDLADEFNALIRQILVANGRAASGAFEFDGASSFLLWGALFLNPTRVHNRVSLVEALAHEAAHNLLFGLSIDDILVLNPETELFTSPLRVDPRPMEGIYHATFVSARMAYAVEKLLASGQLETDETAFARESLAASRDAFDGGFGDRFGARAPDRARCRDHRGGARLHDGGGLSRISVGRAWRECAAACGDAC